MGIECERWALAGFGFFVSSPSLGRFGVEGAAVAADLRGLGGTESDRFICLLADCTAFTSGSSSADSRGRFLEGDAAGFGMTCAIEAGCGEGAGAAADDRFESSGFGADLTSAAAGGAA